MSCPYFVYRHFPGVFIHADFGHLRRIRICRRWSDPGAFVLAATRFRRRSIGPGTGKGAMEINGRDHRLFEGQEVFLAFLLPLLLERTAKYLALHSPTDRDRSLCGF